MFKCNIPILQTNEIEVRVDNRNTSVKTLKDSKDSRDVQITDYVANLVWKKYNSPNEDLSRRVSQYYRTHISKFPFKLFGINPTLKQLEQEKAPLKN